MGVIPNTALTSALKNFDHRTHCKHNAKDRFNKMQIGFFSTLQCTGTFSTLLLLRLLATGRWFPPGIPVSSTRKLISSSSFHLLDMTLAVAEALNANKLNQTKPNHLL